MEILSAHFLNTLSIWKNGKDKSFFRKYFTTAMFYFRPLVGIVCLVELKWFLELLLGEESTL